VKRTSQSHSARPGKGQANVAEEVFLRPPGFGYRKRAAGKTELFCESVSLGRLAERYGTPLYVYSAAAIRARLNAFARAFASVPHTLCYSVKANSTLRILRLIASTRAGFDIVSVGELQRVLRVTRQTANRVVFSGVGKTQDEMRLALRAGILLFNVESASELRMLSQTAAKLRKVAPIAIRVNPDVSANTHPYISTGLHEHKFGVPVPEARSLYAEAANQKSLKVAGISVHIGSQITDVSSFQAALERVGELVRELRREGHDIRYVDAGGGLGIGYEGPPDDFNEQIAAYARALLTPLKGLNVHLLIEPGRSITGPAGVLLTRVLYRKTNNSKRFLIVDAAMNDLLRPSLYGAHHDIVPVLRESSSPVETTDVVGPICETGDFFARARELPHVEEGGLLAILDTGAYGSVLASNYNSRGRPADVLVTGQKATVIRRRESGEDLIRLEK
jgi:diaminopimelate decarboxylase